MSTRLGRLRRQTDGRVGANTKTVNDGFQEGLSRISVVDGADIVFLKVQVGRQTVEISAASNSLEHLKRYMVIIIIESGRF